jgi:hypothetical protein
LADKNTTRRDLEELVRVAQTREKTARNHLNAAMEANRQNPAQGKTPAAKQTEDRLTREYRAAQQKTKSEELNLLTFDRIAARKRQKEVQKERELKEIGDTQHREAGKPARGFRRRGRSFDRER